MLALNMGGYGRSADVIKVRGHSFSGSSWVQPPCSIGYAIRPWSRVIGGKDRFNEILFLGLGERVAKPGLEFCTVRGRLSTRDHI